MLADCAPFYPLLSGVKSGQRGNIHRMSKPQQPELARNRKGATDHDAAEMRAREGTTRVDPGGAGGLGPVPEENQPGHRPEVEQDKPTGPPNQD